MGFVLVGLPRFHHSYCVDGRSDEFRIRDARILPQHILLPSFSSSVRLQMLRRTGFLERARKRRPVSRAALNTGTSPNNPEGGNGVLGTTRLGRIIQERQKDFSARFNTVRKDFPLKIFLLLLGYYSANALATILGQTGDWDVLASGILVALMEGVGYLMYRMPSVLGVKGKELVLFLNFWKSGFSFGLFVDAFKLGS